VQTPLNGAAPTAVPVAVFPSVATVASTRKPSIRVCSEILTLRRSRPTAKSPLVEPEGTSPNGEAQLSPTHAPLTASSLPARCTAATQCCVPSELLKVMVHVPATELRVEVAVWAPEFVGPPPQWIVRATPAAIPANNKALVRRIRMVHPFAWPCTLSWRQLRGSLWKSLRGAGCLVLFPRSIS
jgi:hypothetical protein